VSLCFSITYKVVMLKHNLRVYEVHGAKTKACKPMGLQTCSSLLVRVPGP
jgi:hypothetical protein